jgi:phosphomevalonate kinase
MCQALIAHNTELFRAYIVRAQDLLHRLQQQTGLTIETPTLRQLRVCAEKIGAVAKSSGAGGGDCGIAFVCTPEQSAAITRQWRAHAIEPLAIHPYERTIEVTNR